MKLISFGNPGKEIPGVIIGEDAVLDIRAASAGRIQTIRQLLEMGEEGLEQVQEWVENIPRNVSLIFKNQVRFGPPITNPTKIIGVGLNYHSHTGEQNSKVPTKPLLFSKASTCLSGHGDPIWYPIEEENVDYEAELAVVIGKSSFRIDQDKWEEHVAGYTIVNDVSGRDAQFSDKKWFRGKSYDSFCPIGPWIVTKDEIPDPHGLAISAKLNNEIRQENNTKNMIFDIPTLLSFISRNITLKPGDIISTGTPGGVGIFMEPPACMLPGDEITIFVEKIGKLTSYVKERPEEANDEIFPSVYPSP